MVIVVEYVFSSKYLDFSIAFLGLLLCRIESIYERVHVCIITVSETINRGSFASSN